MIAFDKRINNFLRDAGDYFQTALRQQHKNTSSSPTHFTRDPRWAVLRSSKTCTRALPRISIPIHPKIAFRVK